MKRGRDDPRQLFKCCAAQAVNTSIADMEQVRRARFDDDAAEGADVAALTVVSVLALLSLRIKPGIGGDQHMLGRGFDRPGIRGAVIIFKKAGHRCLRCLLADIAATDAVSQRDGNAFATQLRPIRHQHAMEILIELLAPLVRKLSNRNPEMLAHADTLALKWKSSRPHGREPDESILVDQRARFGAVRTCVEYIVRPTKNRPPTRLPSAVGSSFQIR